MFRAKFTRLQTLMATSFSNLTSSTIALSGPEVLLAAAPAFTTAGKTPSDTSQANFRIPLAGGFLVFSELPPTYLLPLIEKIAGFSTLTPNWDSYGALSINPLCIAASVQLALQLIGPEVPIPFAGPTVGGGVQLEWHRRGKDLEVYIEFPSRISAFFSDDESGEELSFDISDRFDQLRMYLDRMKERSS